MKKYWHIINLLITLMTLTGIYLVTSGKTSLERVSDSQNSYEAENLTLPPGYAFGIWGVIYLGFLLFSLLQLSPGLRNDSKFYSSRWLITTSVTLNLVWIVLVGTGAFIIPYFLQWVMMTLAVVIVLRIRNSETSFHSDFDRLSFIPFALHAGWLIVAMIPYSTNVLLSLGWRGGPLTVEAWAIIIYITGCVIVYVTYQRTRVFWCVVPWLWALLTFAQKFSGIVGCTAWILLGIMTALMICELWRRRKIT